MGHVLVVETDNYTAIIENKVKSLGNDLQLERYRTSNNDVIGLGFVEVSFKDVSKENKDASKEKIPILTYKDILSILNGLQLSIQQDAFTNLVDHYRLYLQKELAVLDRIKKIYFGGGVNHDGFDHGSILNQEINESYNDNDIRFFNYVYLEYLRRELENDDQLKLFKWNTNKNMIGGPWISGSIDIESDYIIGRELKRQFNAFGVEKLWFHIQIKKGISEDNEKTSGMMQLKTKVIDNDNKKWLNEFKKLYELCDNQSWNKRVKKGSKTFYLVAEPFIREDMVAGRMLPKVKKFINCFGKFLS